MSEIKRNLKKDKRGLYIIDSEKDLENYVRSKKGERNDESFDRNNNIRS
jgi:hypothetical protein